MSSGFDDLARFGVIGSCTPVSDVASGKLVLGVVIRTRAALCFFLFFFAFIHGRDDVRKENGNCIFPPPLYLFPPSSYYSRNMRGPPVKGRLWQL